MAQVGTSSTTTSVCVGCQKNYVKKGLLNAHYDRLIRKPDNWFNPQHSLESMNRIRALRAGVVRRGIMSTDEKKSARKNTLRKYYENNREKRKTKSADDRNHRLALACMGLQVELAVQQ